MVSILESTVYWFVWMGTGLYILYCFSVESRTRLPLLDKSDFVNGWKILDRSKDTSDEEWTILKAGWDNYWPWFVGHLFLRVIRKHLTAGYKNMSALIYTSYSLVSMIVNFGFLVPLLYLSVISLWLLLCLFRSRILCYVTAFSLLYFLHAWSLSFIENYVNLQTHQFILIELGFSWLVARMLAVSLETIESNSLKDKIVPILLYCFYLPLFYTGPIMSFDIFVQQFYYDDSIGVPWNAKQIMIWFGKVIKYVVYYLILEFLLHFLYSTSVQFYPEIVEQMDTWTLCGLGYSLSVVFYMKYVIIYGFGGVFAEFDHFTLPPPPKCISRINLNSSMWKHFDRGLYLWITRYLYIPITGPDRLIQRRLFASFCCFLFMSLWHGMHKSVFLWCFLNFLAVSVEMSVSRFYATYLLEWRIRNMSDNTFLRCKALLGAFSFLHLCLSCMFFLSNWEVGLIISKRILLGFPVPLLPTLFIMYSESQVAFQVAERESLKDYKRE